MPWRTVSAADVLKEFTSIERATIEGVQGDNKSLDAILADTVAEFVGAMNAANYATVADGSVPDQLRRHIIARARWGFLTSLPGLKDDPMLSEARKKAAETAESILLKVNTREFGNIEAPVASTAKQGNWNSEPRLVMRTHPIPPPASQSQPSTYANPDAPGDTQS